MAHTIYAVHMGQDGNMECNQAHNVLSCRITNVSTINFLPMMEAMIYIVWWYNTMCLVSIWNRGVVLVKWGGRCCLFQSYGCDIHEGSQTRGVHSSPKCVGYGIRVGHTPQGEQTIIPEGMVVASCFGVDCGQIYVHLWAGYFYWGRWYRRVIPPEMLVVFCVGVDSGQSYVHVRAGWFYCIR